METACGSTSMTRVSLVITTTVCSIMRAAASAASMAAADARSKKDAMSDDTE